MRIGLVDKRLFTILMIVFVQMLGASMVLPVLPLFARREFDMSPQVITLLVSSFFVAQFAAGPYIGRLSDRYGRVPVLIVSQIGTAISFVMLAVAGSPTELFASRILDGITGGNIIAAQAYITDITPREKRTQSLGYIFAAFGLGFIIGPAAGGLLSAVYGESTPFWVAAVAATLTILLTWTSLNETLTPEQRESNRRIKKSGLAPLEIIRNVPLLLILVIAFVGQFSLGLVQSTFALFGEAVLFDGYAERATNIGIGLLFTTIGFSQFFTQTILLPRAIKRLDEENIVVLGLAVRTIGMFIWAIALTPWLGVAGTLFFATGFGLAMPTLQSLSTNTVPDEVRGGVLGIYQSAISLSIIVGTATGGVLFAITPATPYWIGGGLSVISVLPALVLARYISTRALC